jgi:hypothetical protein
MRLRVLISDGKLAPMIVVMPNGRAMKDDRAIGNIMAPEVQAFATFEQDLLQDLIPFVEKLIHYGKVTKQICQFEKYRI